MRKKIVIIILIIAILLIIVFKIYSKNNQNSNSKINKKNEPTISGPYKHTKVIEDNYGGSGGVKIKYDQYVTANGYMGASDNVYYTRNGSLYHLIVSTNKTTKLAEGVGKIENSMETVIVHKSNNFKIIEEDNYVTYTN
ncbi:MAG: hypothetical protein IJF92_01975 [Bacilli bacterium]|nr:hypothetical protein [Bacilli bacterium]